LNLFFLFTLIIDWIYLGFSDSYSKHPRVFTETVSQVLFMYAIYMMLGKGTIQILFQYVEELDPAKMPSNWKALL
jgi:hypothetical protein